MGTTDFDRAVDLIDVLVWPAFALLIVWILRAPLRGMLHAATLAVRERGARFSVGSLSADIGPPGPEVLDSFPSLSLPGDGAGSETMTYDDAEAYMAWNAIRQAVYHVRFLHSRAFGAALSGSRRMT